MVLLVVLIIAAAESSPDGRGTSAPDEHSKQQFGLSLGVGADAEPSMAGRIANTAAWLDFEVNYRVVSWLRVQVSVGGAWSPEFLPNYPGQHGILRAIAGIDLFKSFFWGGLFLGAAGGGEFTNIFFDENWPPVAGYSTKWFAGPCVLGRGGIEFWIRQNATLGGTAAYSFFREPRLGDDRHAAELRLRLTFMF